MVAVLAAAVIWTLFVVWVTIPRRLGEANFGSRIRDRLRKQVKVLVAFTVVGLLAIAIIATWVWDTDARGKRFVDAGIALSVELERLSELFLAGQTDAIAELLHPAAVVEPWRLVPGYAVAEVDWYTFEPSGAAPLDTPGALEVFRTWRDSIVSPEKTVFRLLFLDDLVSSTEAGPI